MLSIPGSSLRLSCAISNSYSKSEIARIPLTIAWASFVAANSTSRVEKICTSTLPRSAVASSMNALALLRREERLLLAQRIVDDADDDLVEDVGGAGDDVDVAVGDRVVAARTDDGAVALAHGSLLPRRVDRDVGGAVAALAQTLQRVDPQRAAGAALDDGAPIGGQHAGEVRVHFLGHGVGESIGGVDEDEVEAGVRRSALASQSPASARTSSRPLPQPEVLDVAEGRPGVAVDQDGAGGAARERLDRQRPGAAVEVEDDGVLHPLAERGEDRLADALGGRPHLPPRGASSRCPFNSPAITRIAHPHACLRIDDN